MTSPLITAAREAERAAHAAREHTRTSGIGNAVRALRHLAFCVWRRDRSWWVPDMLLTRTGEISSAMRGYRFIITCCACGYRRGYVAK